MDSDQIAAVQTIQTAIEDGGRQVGDSLIEVAESLDRVAQQFTTPNETDRNLEPANVVDGLYFIGRAITRLAEAVENSQYGKEWEK